MLSKREQRIVDRCLKSMDGIQIEETTMQKNNGKIWRGIKINQTDRYLGIVIYWDNIWKLFGEECPEGTAADYILETVKSSLADIQQYEELLDWGKMKEQVRKKVVNYERNAERLEQLVYRRYLNLAEVYYIPVSLPKDAGGFTEVTKALFNSWEISEEELVQTAGLNMRREGYCVKTMQELLEKGQFPIENETPYMYVVCNQSRCLGAGIITDPELLGEAARAAGIESDFYILPSSVHELIFILDDGTSKVDELQKLVEEVNTFAVSEEEFLADSIYYYDVAKCRISMLA